MEWVSLAKYCRDTETDYVLLYNTIIGYEKQGTIPIFAKRVDNSYYVLPKMINYYHEIEMEAWKYSTGRLYWLLTDWMKLSHTEIGKIASKISKIYNKPASWQVFLSNRLFNLPEKTIYSPRVTMTQEFVKVGTKMVIDHWNIYYAKHEFSYCKDFDWDSHIAQTAWIRYQEAV